jgi:hypothetical protein
MNSHILTQFLALHPWEPPLPFWHFLPFRVGNIKRTFVAPRTSLRLLLQCPRWRRRNNAIRQMSNRPPRLRLHNWWWRLLFLLLLQLLLWLWCRWEEERRMTGGGWTEGGRGRRTYNIANDDALRPALDLQFFHVNISHRVTSMQKNPFSLKNTKLWDNYFSNIIPNFK